MSFKLRIRAPKLSHSLSDEKEEEEDDGFSHEDEDEEG